MIMLAAMIVGFGRMPGLGIEVCPLATNSAISAAHLCLSLSSPFFTSYTLLRDTSKVS